ncbi:MAG: GxxExxY protein [Planctomycetota bacterium]|jgi:GxxExxY protein
MTEDNYTSEHEDSVAEQDDRELSEVREEAAEERPRGRHSRRERDPVIEDIIHELIGSSIEVHKALGPGLDASAYKTALAIELFERDMPTQKDVTAEVFYKETKVAEGSVDFILDGKLPVGILSVEKLLPVHNAKMLAYLRATDTKVGMLINFNAHLLKEGLRRIVL